MSGFGFGRGPGLRSQSCPGPVVWLEVSIGFWLLFGLGAGFVGVSPQREQKRSPSHSCELAYRGT